MIIQTHGLHNLLLLKSSNMHGDYVSEAMQP